MSNDFSAYTVLGVRILNSEFINSYVMKNSRKQKGCDHEVPDAANFCSECGAKREITIAPPYDQHEFSEYLQKEFSDIRIVEDDESKPKYLYIGLSCGTDKHHENGKLDIPDQKSLEKLKTLLETLFSYYQVWDSSNFGIWTISSESYL